ncbi:orotidine 5-phosphate decarboxylase [Verrucomicrobiaceae bacterium SCGC AG-212-N21]|nr:orotidine 5-phosphate decarboxylase [Verrucomicrobiaceae bacterium SCGC AG-212-N21]
MTYAEKLSSRINATGSGLCVGLDVRATSADEARSFIRDVVDQTSQYAAAFKPNAAYFEAMGWQGVKLLEELRGMIPAEIPIILDVKRGDIGETQRYYAKACFDVIGADAVTLNPFMGRDTIEPFLEYADKGLYLLAVTSNPGAKDIEMQRVGERQVFELVCDMLKGAPQAGLVVGLTNASGDILSKVPDVPLLIPGLGAQGGDVEALRASKRQAPNVVNVSRGILYAEPGKSFAEKAKTWAKMIAG